MGLKAVGHKALGFVLCPVALVIFAAECWIVGGPGEVSWAPTAGGWLLSSPCIPWLTHPSPIPLGLLSAPQQELGR